MTVVHHLDDATLMRFASGDLDEAFSVAVAAHLELCGGCRAALRAAEAYGGRLLEQAEEVAVSEKAFDRLRSHIKDSEINLAQAKHSKAQSKRPVSANECSVPKPLQRYIGSSLEGIAWTKVAPGVLKRDISLTSKTSNKLYMLHIAAGKKVPEHGHGGAEITLVLSGAYQDNTVGLRVEILPISMSMMSISPK